MINKKSLKYICYILIPLLAIALISRGNLYDDNLSVNTDNLLSYFFLNTLSLLMGITYFETIRKYLNFRYSLINLVILLLSTLIPYGINIIIDEIHVFLGYIMVFGIGIIALTIAYKLFLNSDKIGNIAINILLIGYILCIGMFISFGHVNSIMEIIYIFLINSTYYLFEKCAKI